MHNPSIKVTTALAAIVILLLIGTALFHALEGWNWVDSFYFTGITLFTIGYGDIVPTQPLTKVITVFWGFIGISVVLFTMTIFAKMYLEFGQERLSGEVKSIGHKIKRLDIKKGPSYEYKIRSKIAKKLKGKLNLRNKLRRSSF